VQYLVFFDGTISAPTVTPNPPIPLRKVPPKERFPTTSPHSVAFPAITPVVPPLACHNATYKADSSRSDVTRPKPPSRQPSVLIRGMEVCDVMERVPQNDTDTPPYLHSPPSRGCSVLYSLINTALSRICRSVDTIIGTLFGASVRTASLAPLGPPTPHPPGVTAPPPLFFSHRRQ